MRLLNYGQKQDENSRHTGGVMITKMYGGDESGVGLKCYACILNVLALALTRPVE